MTEWHNCDSHIGSLLKYAMAPPATINDGQPFWFINIIENKGIAQLIVKYCPVCGVDLGEEHGQRDLTCWRFTCNGIAIPDVMTNDVTVQVTPSVLAHGFDSQLMPGYADSFVGRLEELGSRFEKLKVEVLNAFSPLFRPVLDRIFKREA